VAQEVFVRVWKRLDQCRDPERFAAWLLSIARNACLDHLRRRKARPPAQDVPAEELWSLADPGQRADQRTLEQDQRDVLEAALQQLSDINREAILLKDIQELPLEDMATMLGLPLGTVKSRCPGSIAWPATWPTWPTTSGTAPASPSRRRGRPPPWRPC